MLTSFPVTVQCNPSYTWSLEIWALLVPPLILTNHSFSIILKRVVTKKSFLVSCFKWSVQSQKEGYQHLLLLFLLVVDCSSCFIKILPGSSSPMIKITYKFSSPPATDSRDKPHSPCFITICNDYQNTWLKFIHCLNFLRLAFQVRKPA